MEDVFVNLPTGSGKSLIYQALPLVFDHVSNMNGHIVVVVSTRNAVNRLARKELNPNPVVLELSKEKETFTSSSIIRSIR